MPMPEITTDTIRAAQGGDQDAMWEIISGYDPLLISIISAAAPHANAEQREDLHQEARAVLLARVHAYTVDADAAALYTYAYRAVHGAVLVEWTRMTTAPAADPETVRRARTLMAEMDGDLEAVVAEMHTRYRASRTVVLAACDAAREVWHWDHRVTRGSAHLALSDVVPATEPSPSAVATSKHLAHWLLSQIAARQAHCLRAYYGIGARRRDDREVASEMGITPATVRQLRARGVSAARRVAAAHDVAA